MLWISAVKSPVIARGRSAWYVGHLKVAVLAKTL